MNLNRLATLFILLTVFVNKLSAQTLPGRTTWEGTLTGLKIILVISEDSATKQKTAEYAVPQQNASGIKVSRLIITKDSLTADASVMSSTYTAAFNADKTQLTGTWKQRGGQFPLTLKKVANQKPLNRPQTPKPPFPYSEEKVIYFNKDKSIQYGATLTLPNSPKNVPAVILITGSGQEDRDEALFGHKLFWVIADHLSRNGIAVLRVDDRGVGETTGDIKNATSADFAKDVLVGMDYLKTHKGIDSRNIGLIGHSEGGMIAPLAANQSDDVAFIVSLAGVGVKGVDLLATQQAHVYSKAGFNAEEVSKMQNLVLTLVKIGNENTTEAAYWPAYKEFMTNWVEQQPDAFLIKAGFSGPKAPQLIAALGQTFFTPWQRYFFNYDPAATLTKITIPVLALNGEKDIQVDAKANLEGFNKLLTQAGNKHFKTVSMLGLNHMFQHANTGEVSEYEQIEETISPEVLDIITKWIKELKPRK